MTLDQGYRYLGFNNRKPPMSDLAFRHAVAYLINKLAHLQAETVNLKERRRIILRLQNILAGDLPIIPLYIPHRMEGVWTGRFSGWVKQTGGVGNI